MAIQHIGIISGNGSSNQITPAMDASWRSFISGEYMGGNALDIVRNGNVVNINGITIYEGYIAYFENAEIDIQSSGYIYVHYEVNGVADAATVLFSTTEQYVSGQTIADLYFKVATISDGVLTKNNAMEYPDYAKNADIANIVATTILDGAVATTQATGDNSRKVATTEFVQNAIEVTQDSTVKFFGDDNFVATIYRQARKTYCKSVVSYTIPSTTWIFNNIAVNTPIATIPVGYRPLSSSEDFYLSIMEAGSNASEAAVIKCTIGTNGNVVVTGGLQGSTPATLSGLACSFIITFVYDHEVITS